MYGAILGDIIGSPFEFDRGDKTKDFKLFSRRSHFTDDSVMTLAVCEALLKSRAGCNSQRNRRHCYIKYAIMGKKISSRRIWRLF